MGAQSLIRYLLAAGFALASLFFLTFNDPTWARSSGGGTKASQSSGSHSNSGHVSNGSSKSSQGSSHSSSGHAASSRSSSGHSTSPSHSSSSKASGVQRDKDGKIARSPQAKSDFKKSHPCPSTGKSSGACPGYVVDHVKPLKKGGADSPSNMQWQTKEAAKQKDKWE